MLYRRKLVYLYPPELLRFPGYFVLYSFVFPYIHRQYALSHNDALSGHALIIFSHISVCCLFSNTGSVPARNVCAFTKHYLCVGVGFSLILPRKSLSRYPALCLRRIQGRSRMEYQNHPCALLSHILDIPCQGGQAYAGSGIIISSESNSNIGNSHNSSAASMVNLCDT